MSKMLKMVKAILGIKSETLESVNLNAPLCPTKDNLVLSILEISKGRALKVTDVISNETGVFEECVNTSGQIAMTPLYTELPIATQSEP